MPRFIPLALLIFVVGCASSTYIPTINYRLAPEIAVNAANAETKTGIGLRTLDAAQPTNRAMSFTTDGFSLQAYPNATWAESPREAVTDALLDALNQTGRFDAANAANMRAPEFVMTGQLRVFHEDRTGEQAQAVCEVRLDLRARSGEEATWSASIRAAEPLHESGPVELARAMSEAVAQVAEEAAASISEALPDSVPPE